MAHSNWHTFKLVVLVVLANGGFSKSAYIKNPLAELDPPNPTEPPPPSSSHLGYYYDAAVAGNCHPCPIVGRNVMMDGGNVVDAALASLFCEGVACLHSMGLGGGFFMTIYNRTTGEVSTLNARETAPAAATEDMFHGDSELAQKGGLAIGVPGELKGYWEVYQRFGSLPWSRIIQPTIDLCEEGLLITGGLASVIKQKEDDILESETLSEILTDPETGSILKEGDRIYRPGLAQTLRIIAAEGGEALYTGSLVQQFVEDIQAVGGIITAQDMANYRVRWEEPVVVNLQGGLKAYTVTAPSSGPILAFILNALDGFIPASDPVTTHHRIIETFKWAYGQRTQMGDSEFIDIQELLSNLTSKDFAVEVRQDKIFDTRTFDDPAYYGGFTQGTENHGTAHISVLAPDGSAVSATSTINLYFGSKFRSPSTDIILNDIMDDFSSPNITNDFGVPPSPANFIVPGKRPLSSMCPTVIVESNGDVKMVIGSSGGTKITSSVPWVTMRHLLLNETIKEAIDAPRVHHQLYPMTADYEFGIVEDIVLGLEQLGHNTSRFGVGGSTVAAIARIPGYITANSDFRRNASIAGY